MHIITRTLLGLAILASVAVTRAEEFTMVVPFPPGNQTDNVARAIQASIEKNTSDRLVIINMPGAETIIGATHFKNNKNMDTIFSSGSQLIFNPLMKENLAYSDEDFDHVIYVGTSIGVWVTRPNTNLKTAEDLVKHMPEFVGGYSHSYNFNVNALVAEKQLKSSIVPHKGTNEVIIGLLNNSLDLGVVAPNSNLLQLVKAGKLHIIGNTYNRDLVLDGIDIPAVNKKLGVTQFNGFLAIDLQPGMEPNKAARLKKLLWDAIKDPATAELIKNLYVQPDASIDKAHILSTYENYRKSLKKFLNKSTTLAK